MADVCAVGVGRRHADWPGRQGPSVCHCTAGVVQAHLCTADAHVPEHADADSVALVVQRSALGRGSFLANARCAPLAHSPLPLIFSYTSEKSLCGEQGPTLFLAPVGWVACRTMASRAPESTRLTIGQQCLTSTTGLRYLLRPLYMEYLYVEFVCKCLCVFYIYVGRSR